MSQTIQCLSCKAETKVAGIADLISTHTDTMGRFSCGECGGVETFFERDQDADRPSKTRRWIKGILPMETKTAGSGYTPFVFLTGDAPNGAVSGLEFKYYWPSRSNGRGKKPARRPDGGAWLTQLQLLGLVSRLANIGVVSTTDWRQFLRHLEAAPVAKR